MSAVGAVPALAAAGVAPGTPVALVTCPGGGALAADGTTLVLTGDVEATVAAVEQALSPRWVWWSAGGTASGLAAAGVRPARSWDLAAVHRVLHGGAADDPGRVWAAAHGLPEAAMPRGGQLDLLTEPPPTARPDGDGPVGPDGYLQPGWAEDPAARLSGSPATALRWSELALEVQRRQADTLLARPDPRPTPVGPHQGMATAYAESAATQLAVELTRDGLPLDREVAHRLLAALVGPPPRSAAHEQALRAERDAPVLAAAARAGGSPETVDLRNPAAVRELLARRGIDVPDTRSWRLEPYRTTSPLVDELLRWRRAERFSTTYGYGWLDRHVAADGRLRGVWSASDGAGGRMTASAGLHNLPAELRPAVRAEPGTVLVRADLGQIEPRVLAAVSGDPALAAATLQDDVYRPVADRLRCDRPTAKIAVLAAMYGQTSGAAGEALRGLDRAYPIALAYLRAAEEDGRAGRDVVTHGGRRVRMSRPAGGEPVPVTASRGRFARNAVVQGAAAELFKAWAATVRAGLRGRGQIVLCLHDELLLLVPVGAATDAAALLHDALGGASARWAAGSGVRFVADVSVLDTWAEAKGGPPPG